MRRLAAIMAGGVALSGCATEKAATFTCVNGPDLAALYAEDSVTLSFSNGDAVVLTRPDPSRPNLYASGSTSWAVGMREARLGMDGRSLICDQLD